MNALDRNVGLVAGAVAALTYAVCVFFLDLSLWLALVPAVAVCGAVLLVSPGGPLNRKTPTQAEKAAMIAARAKIASIQQMLGQLPASQPGRASVVGIVENANKIQNAIEQDWNKFQAAKPFLDSYLEPIETWLKHYVLCVTRGVNVPKPIMDTAEKETLPRMNTQLEKLYQKLHVKDFAFLMGGGEVELNFPKIEVKALES